MKFKTIRQTATIDAAPADVYNAYTDPKTHSAFTGSPSSGSPRVGGRFTAWDGYIEGRYLELENGRKVVHEWKTTDWPDGYPPSLVELTFKPKGRRTELVMVHSSVPAEQAAEYAEGWTEYYWEPLKKYFEGRERAVVELLHAVPRGKVGKAARTGRRSGEVSVTAGKRTSRTGARTRTRT